MNKLYVIISVIVFLYSARAQVSLTNGSNQPTLGDVNSKLMCDSAGVVPKNTGANQLWDFSAFPINTHTEISNYVTAVNSAFTNTSFVENYGQTYFYMRALPSTYEIVGIENPNFTLNFSSNSAIQFMWPVSMGYSKTDALSGTVHASNMNGNVTGNIITTASGTGTLIVPGGNTYTNVLQVKIRLTATASFLFGLATANLKVVDYTYYDALHKFPLLTVSYVTSTGAYTANTAVVKVSAGVVGINDLNLDASFNVFPNPAKNNFTITLSNPSQVNGIVEVINSLGQVVKITEFGNRTEISENISVTDLVPGIYMIKICLGDKRSFRKLIVE